MFERRGIKKPRQKTSQKIYQSLLKLDTVSFCQCYTRSGDLHSQDGAVDLANISGATLQYNILLSMSKRAVASGPQ